MLRTKKVTLQSIADKAGVSKNAVSLILRGQARASEKTSTKVRRLAEDLGYVPNFAARSLTLKRSGLVGIFLHSIYDHVRLEYVKCLLDSLHDEQFRPVLGFDEQHQGPWYESAWVRTFEQINVDAIVLVGAHTSEIPQSLKRIPIISIGNTPDSTPPCDSVVLDRCEAGAMAVRHLIDKGHQKIVSVSSKHSFADGVANAIKAYPGISWEHIDISYLFSEPHERPIMEVIADSIINSSLHPSAAILSDSLLAAQTTKLLLSRGVSIPNDLAIIAYDCLPNVDTCAISLTLVEQPVQEMASAAKELLIRRIASPHADYQQITLAHQLVERASTAGTWNPTQSST